MYFNYISLKNHLFWMFLGLFQIWWVDAGIIHIKIFVLQVSKP